MSVFEVEPSEILASHRIQLLSCSLFAEFNRWRLFSQMFSENDEVLNVDNAVTPWRRTNVAQRIPAFITN